MKIVALFTLSVLSVLAIALYSFSTYSYLSDLAGQYSHLSTPSAVGGHIAAHANNSSDYRANCKPCASVVVKAADELLDGYYTTAQDYTWVPFASALRFVNDSVTVEPFDMLFLSDSLDRLMIEWICSKLPSSKWLPPQNNKFPGFGEGRAICRSDWGNLTWYDKEALTHCWLKVHCVGLLVMLERRNCRLLIAGSKPIGPYHYVGDEKEFYTPQR